MCTVRMFRRQGERLIGEQPKTHNTDMANVVRLFVALRCTVEHADATATLLRVPGIGDRIVVRAN
jgi:hypothetical protein